MVFHGLFYILAWLDNNRTLYNIRKVMSICVSLKKFHILIKTRNKIIIKIRTLQKASNANTALLQIIVYVNYEQSQP